ncbi:MAG TPA: glucose 1-dehydrogenase [Dehalococcoidia bacterium]|nr:glucose 1-dehydrogenase [Dehalococcoidia bacterium]
MKAIVLTPGTTTVQLADRAEPSIGAPDEVKLQVLQVGICGTDRDEAAGGRAVAPPGRTDLVIGHEMLGRVIEVGSAVQSARPGDYALFTVRRGCGHCANCAINRSDMCYTGDYADRGIHLRDGYQTEFVVDSDAYVIPVPPSIASVAVLTEPMSIAEKAIDEAVQIQIGRLPDATDAATWLDGKNVLVAGLGPIGLLAAVALRLRGANVQGLDVVDADTIRPRILGQLGGTYVDGRKVNPRALGEHFPQIELIFEATGVAQLEFDLLSALGTNGVYVLTGIAGGDRPVTIDGSALMKALVLRNQVTVGSVNASHKHFGLAVADLQRAQTTWGNALDAVITHRLPYTGFADALSHHPADEIKTILEWSPL